MKISNYAIAKYLIESATDQHDCNFIDLPVVMSDDPVGLKGGKICVGRPESWGQFMFNAATAYLDGFSSIHGVELYTNDRNRDFVISVLANFIDAITTDNDSEKQQDAVLMRLYQCPMVWLLMKDVVCPAYQIKYNNVLIACGDAVEYDIAQYIIDDDQKFQKESFVFVNNSIKYNPIRDAFVFAAVLEAHGCDSVEIIREILQSELSEKIESVASLVYDDDSKVDNFILMLRTYAHLENSIEKMMVDMQKTASVKKEAAIDATISNPFWYFGILEKILGPARGSDWSVYEDLMPYFREIRDKIEVERKKKGRDGISYEFLLRMKDGENSKKENHTVMENKLKPNRVW